MTEKTNDVCTFLNIGMYCSYTLTPADTHSPPSKISLFRSFCKVAQRPFLSVAILSAEYKGRGIKISK